MSNPVVNRVLHYVILAVTGLATFAPELPGLQLLLPANVYHALALACATALWLMQSPLFKPLLPVKTPDAVIQAETTRALDDVVKRQATIPPGPMKGTP